MTKSEHKAKFDHSVAVLVKAYMDDTLRHMDCATCAVGNLIADVCGYEITNENSKWNHKGTIIEANKWHGAIHYNWQSVEADSHIKLLGYSIEDFKKNRTCLLKSIVGL